MAGVMQRRVCRFPREKWLRDRVLKGFHANQKDNSKRAKRRAGLNNYKEQKED